MDAASVTLSVGDYVFFSIMGICVVFFALILLMCIIKIMTFSPKKAEEPAAAGAGAAGGAAAPAADKPLAPGTAGDLKLYDTDPRDAAMIMAIVADELKKPLNELRFISIREVK
ncbi:MAG: OadG family protein [Eggerthellaceae bacterium]|nr:OadG family protein [Eggerthellaceae bacterium]